MSQSKLTQIHNHHFTPANTKHITELLSSGLVTDEYQTFKLGRLTYTAKTLQDGWFKVKTTEGLGQPEIVALGEVPIPAWIDEMVAEDAVKEEAHIKDLLKAVHQANPWMNA